jgi:hypothetical protein
LYPSSGTRVEVPGPESWWPRWSRDSHRVFFATLTDIQEVDVRTDPELRIGIPRRLFARPLSGTSAPPAPFDVSGDGERFLVVEPDRSLISSRRSMVVVMNFTPGGRSSER